MSKIFATKDPQMSQREKRNMDRARNLASQGMVLLKNDGVLPLKNCGMKIALFGSGARRTVKGGTGSGDVNSRIVINVEQGLKNAGLQIMTHEWLDEYDRLCEDHMASHMQKVMGIMQEKGAAGIPDVLALPFTDPDVPAITQDLLERVDADAAVYVIGRTSGEAKDRRLDPGDYYLTDGEKQNLDQLTEACEHVIVVLNVGGVMDTSYLTSRAGIGAIVLMSQAGNISGDALADILTGKANPSGHLTATWARRYEDYPGSDSFGHINGGLDDEYYNEGIFVGYRYFDTFGVTPAYPFGFGLSYTAFTIEESVVRLLENHVEVTVKVRNTGSEHAGREVVQVYYSAPDGKLEKPYQNLADFVKSKLLKPGECQEVRVSFPVADMASYDEESASYILEKGHYYIRVGTHSRNTHVAAKLWLEEPVVTKRLKNVLQPVSRIQEISKQVSAVYTYPGEEQEKENALELELLATAIPAETAAYRSEEEEAGIYESSNTFDDVREGTISLQDLVHGMSTEELATLCVGTARGGFGETSMIGAASALVPGAAGDTTSLLMETRRIPNMVLSDGPAGLRLSKSFVTDSENRIIPGLGESALGGMELLFGGPVPERPEDAIDYYQYCTAIPIATLLAQSWDLELIEEAGDIVGEEMEEFGVTLWLAPGMNIQRNPLCGRNFEYYSEDPILSGMCAAADTRGVQKHKGCGTTIKHFAMNNLEDNRTHNSSNASERTIREIYLKGFETAIRECKPLSVMTSYNLINGVHTANNFDLITSVLRDEWGYEGLVMTDWGTTGRGDLSPSDSLKYGCSDAAGCIFAGNDLIMPGSQEDVDDIVAAVSGERTAHYHVTRKKLEESAARILAVILQSGRAI